ncbi:MAG TPA: DUF1501 domain-containing protein, partial [Planctomycetaceae bacterium]|nr:DUF1501 domain-containing protein [Planctomycetaceae bacterium]
MSARSDRSGGSGSRPSDEPAVAARLSRRAVLERSALGFGWLAFNGLLADRSFATGVALGSPVLPVRAERVVWFFMDGGLSHVDSFDHKPLLEKENGRPLKLVDKREDITGRTTPNVLASPWTFRPYGRCGRMVSDLFPHIGGHADDIAFLHAVTGPSPDHESAIGFLHSGSLLQGFPSVGAWTTYGLGSEAANLPGFVVMGSNKRQCRTNGFLPPAFQASQFFRSGGQPLADLDPREPAAVLQANKRAAVTALDALFLATTDNDRVIEAAIANHEKAHAMQAAVPDAANLAGESAATLAAYGIGGDAKETESFGRYCLTARRLLERGVRFIEIVKGGWDQHDKLVTDHGQHARAVDRPIGAFLADLKARGLLASTLVVFASEFGRTPNTELFGKEPGRDHHPWAFTIWMAGGGVRGGIAHGSTDEYGYHPVEGRVDVHDLHATVLHLLGIDHRQLTYRHSGRDFRLTDVHGHVIAPIVS